MRGDVRVNPAFSIAVRVPAAAVPRVLGVAGEAPGAVDCLLEGGAPDGAGPAVVTLEADGADTLSWLDAALRTRLGADLLDVTDLAFRAAAGGKLGMLARARTVTDLDLALVDADADRRVVTHLAANPRAADDYTGRARRVALLCDGTAVLDLEPIEASTALPALESQALLLHRATGLDVVPLPVAAPGAADVATAVSLLAPGFGATVLIHTGLARIAAIRAALDGTGLVVLDAVNDGLAVAATAAVLSSLGARGIRPPAARVVLVDPARGGELSNLLIAAGVGDLTLYDPVQYGIGALHAVTADEGAVDLVVDLIGLAAPPTSVPVLRTRPQTPPRYAAATAAPRPLHAMPGLLTAALAAHRRPTTAARLAAARTLSGLAAPGDLLPPLDHPDLTAKIAAAVVAAMPAGG
jgi:hypothetical protein